MYNFKYIIRDIFIFVFQVLVLNQLNFQYIHPYIYPLVLFLLPFHISGWILLILGFVLGLGMDLFTGTIGMHTFASVFIAGLRPLIIEALVQNKNDFVGQPNIKQNGILWILSYLSILFLLHHTVYFLIESFNFSSLLFTLFNILASAFCSVVISMIVVLLFNLNTRNER